MRKDTQKKTPWEVFEQIVDIGLYIGFILIMIVSISEKTNLHCDEVYTYVMTNNTYSDTITVAPDWYYIYENPEDVWLRTMTVQEGNAFNFANVWEKQAADNHPPFYYSLVHIVCSFFPTIYSKWFAGTVNIVLGVLLLFTARKIVNILASSQKQLSRFFVSCCLVFSAGMLSALTFFRMYVAAMFFVTLSAYVFLKGTETRNYKFYLSLFATSVLGALTHYYFVVYLLFISLVFGGILILKKKWRDFGVFVGTMALAACTAIAIFPAMLKHVFGTTLRGQQTMDQLTEFSWGALKANLQSAYAIVDSQLFGGLFLTLIVVSILVTILAFIIKKKKEPTAPTLPTYPNRNSFEKWLLLWIPVIGYFIAISKIAVYTTDRYFHPIYALLIILVVTTLCQAIGKLFRPQFAFILLLPILLFSTFKEFGDNWFYLYRSTQSLLDNAAAHSDKDCIFFCDNLFEVDPAFYEVSNYDRVAFVPYAVPERIGELQLRTENGLIVTVTNACDFNVVVQKLQEVWPTLDAYQMLGSHSFSTTYYFY